MAAFGVDQKVSTEPMQDRKKICITSEKWIVAFFTLLAAVALLWPQLAARNGSSLPSILRKIEVSKGLGITALMGLPVMLVLQVVLLNMQDRFDNGDLNDRWGKTLPIRVFDGDHGSSSLHWAFSNAGFGLGAIETCMLAVVSLAVARGAVIGRPAIASSVAMGLVAISSPLMSTSDPYEYVAAGILKFASYSPQPDAFIGSIYEPIARVIPLRGVIYGPLWLLFDTFQTSFGSTIAEKIQALRLWNALLICAVLQLLRTCRVSSNVIILLAINPALWYYTVVNPHADIQGLVLLGLTLYFARRSNLVLAAVALISAGLVKIPFVVIGGAMLLPIPGKCRRLLLWGTSIVAVVAVTYLFQGHAYASDLTTFVIAKSRSNVASGWMIALPIVVVALFALVYFKKSAGGVSILISQAGPITAPWYLYWGLPYAIVNGTGEVYMIAMPLLATLREDMFSLASTSQILTVIVIAALLIDQGVLTSVRRRKLRS